MSLLSSITRLAKHGLPRCRPDVPMLVIFHITTRCNMECRHCGDDVWGDPENDLSFDDIVKISANMGRIECLAIGGGEPFLRKDIVDICQVFAKKNHVTSISIPSNGLLTDVILDNVSSILNFCPDVKLYIALSLDGFEETHDSIRTQGSFARVIETGRQIHALRRKSPNLFLSFCATINNINYNELKPLSKYVRHEFNSNLDFNILTGVARDQKLKVPETSQLSKTIDDLLEHDRASAVGRLYSKLYRDVLIESNSTEKQVIPCRAGSLACLIDANGDLRMCPNLPVLGNLKNKSFQEIWESEQAERQFKSIIQGKCSCNNDCFIGLSLANYWGTPFMMLKNLIRVGNGRSG